VTDQEKQQLAHKLSMQVIDGILGVFKSNERAQGRQVLDAVIANLQTVVERDDAMNVVEQGHDRS
jgi:hypothetical protein